jgi:hypothetical protein
MLHPVRVHPVVGLVVYGTGLRLTGGLNLLILFNATCHGDTDHAHKRQSNKPGFHNSSFNSPKHPNYG